MGFAGSKLLGIRFTDVQTAAQVTSDGYAHPLGSYGEDWQGNGFVYVQANGAIGQYDGVDYVASFDVADIDAGDFYWGVAQVAIEDNGAGWVQVKGACTANVIDATASGSLLARVASTGGDLAAVHATGAAAGDTDGFAVSTSAVTTGLATILIY
jgi:hypothetical protein